MTIIEVTSETKTLPLGYDGENIVRVKFPVEDWQSEFGTDGVFTVLNKRPGDSAAYAAASEVADGIVTWNVTKTDTKTAGRGRCELRYDIGDLTVKSKVWSTVIRPSIGDVSTPPEAGEGWLNVSGGGVAFFQAEYDAKTMTVIPADGTSVSAIWNAYNAGLSVVLRLTNSVGSLTEVLLPLREILCDVSEEAIGTVTTLAAEFSCRSFYMFQKELIITTGSEAVQGGKSDDYWVAVLVESGDSAS